MRTSRRDSAVMKSASIGHRRLRELELLAERLNMIWHSAVSPEPHERERHDAWQVIREIVSLTSLHDAAEKFTAYAVAHPIRLEVHMGRATQKRKEVEPIPVLALPLDEIGLALHQLWHSYFHNQGWKRLKQCPICQKWFVDPTSDTRKARCSVTCTNRWWSYSKRKESDYTRFKKGGYHGTKRR